MMHVVIDSPIVEQMLVNYIMRVININWQSNGYFKNYCETK